MVKQWRSAAVGRALVALTLVFLWLPSGGAIDAQMTSLEVTIDTRYLSADEIGAKKEATLFLRVLNPSGAPVPGASVQWSSSDPSRIAVGPANGVTSAQGSATTQLVAKPRAPRGPVIITSQVTLPSGELLMNTQTVSIAGPVARLVPLPPSLTLTPGDRRKLTVLLVDEAGLPAADGVPVAFSVLMPSPVNVISFLEVPGLFGAVKSKDGSAEITVVANQAGTATVQVQVGTVSQGVGVTVASLAPMPSPTVAVSGAWDPPPRAGMWVLTYWQGDEVGIETAAQAAPDATTFWVPRSEADGLRYLGYSKLWPQASDLIILRRGEGVFVQ